MLTGELLIALMHLQEMDYENASPELKLLYDCLGSSRSIQSVRTVARNQIARDVAIVRDARVKSDFSELAAQLKMMGM